MREAAIDTHRQAAHGASRSRAPGAPPLDGVLGDGPKPSGRKGGITSAAIAAQRLGGGRKPADYAGVGRGRASPGPIVWWSGRLPRVRPLKALSVVAFSVALVGIVANAMVFQKGQHPAPLFGLGQTVEGQPEGAARSTASAVPQAPTPPAPAERTGTIAPAPVAEPAPPAVAATKPAPVHHAVAKPRHEDAIGGLLKAGAEAPATHPRPGHAVAKPLPKPLPKTAAKPDAAEKLLAQPEHAAKPPVKAAETKGLADKKAGVTKPASLATAAPDHHIKADAAPTHHHRLAATPADGTRQATKPD